MPLVPNRVVKLRRDTAARWMAVNPVLADGEPGFERDTGRLKIGDGVLAWNDLPGFIPESYEVPTTPSVPTVPTDVDLSTHILSEAPHPVYDDGRAFDLLYENAKV